MARQADIQRTTGETSIQVAIDLDGSGRADVSTGIGFFDHMLNAFARHGYFDVTVHAEGDLAVDPHHTIEDVGLVLGNAIRDAAGDKVGIHRYGWALLPMDDALVRVALDLCGRPYLVYRVQTDFQEVGGIPVLLFREFFQAVVSTAGLNLHVDRLAGDEPHHIFEAAFKGFGRALDQATCLDPRCTGTPSTKGVLE